MAKICNDPFSMSTFVVLYLAEIYGQTFKMEKTDTIRILIFFVTNRIEKVS